MNAPGRSDQGGYKSGSPGRASSPLRIAIAGGGLSGLAAAHRLVEIAAEQNRRFEITLFESQSRLGGLVGTESIAGYQIDLGGDSFITDKPAALNLCLRLGLKDSLIGMSKNFRGAYILRGKKLCLVPEGVNLMTPSKALPILTTSLLSVPGKLRMLGERFVPPRQDESDESLEAFVVRRFGREAFDRLVQPLVSGIYTADPSKLSIQAALPRFPADEKQYGSLIRAATVRALQKRGSPQQQATGARYGLFLGLKGGMQELVDWLLSRIVGQISLRLSTEVTRVEHKFQTEKAAIQSEVVLHTRGRRPEAFDAVILALPAWKSAELLATDQASLSQELSRIEFASSVIVVTGHQESQIKKPLGAFGLVIPRVERRKILAVSFSHRKFPDRVPSGCALLRTFVGGALQPELCELDDQQLQKLVHQELQEILGVEGEPVVSRIVRYPRAMPQFHLGHRELVARIREQLSQTPRIVLAGNSYDGVGIPDTIASGEQAAERIAGFDTKTESPQP